MGSSTVQGMTPEVATTDSLKVEGSSPDRGKFLQSATKLRRLCFYTCLSVILFTGRGGGVAPLHAGMHTNTQVRHPQVRHHSSQTPPPGQTPPGQTPSKVKHPRGPKADTPTPWRRRPLLRTVRILLECILVCCIF